MRALGALGRTALTATVALGIVGASTLGIGASEGDAAAAANGVCDGLPATIVGTPGNDVITGTPGNDVIQAFEGDDFVDGGGGDDVICGGPGADTIVGGEGNDRIFGGIDAFWVDGNGDHRVGDLISGGPGDDSIDPGADPRASRDHMIPDRVTFQASPQPVTVDMGKGTATGEGTDTIAFVGVMGVVGSQFGDTIIGSSRPDHIEGGAGNDDIRGNAGNDTMWTESMDGSSTGADDDSVTGGAGDDTVYSRYGRDTVTGDAGADSLFALGNPAKVDGGAGNDSLFVTVQRTGVVIAAGQGDDVLTLYAGFAGADRPSMVVDLASGRLEGGGRVSGVEHLIVDDQVSAQVTGTNRAETVVGARGGPLRVQAGGGKDFVYGTQQGDRIDGGKGRDTAWGMAGGNTCIAVEIKRDC